MASTGKFYPFDRYINDISLTLDASHRIVPSKYVLIKSLINKSPGEEQEQPAEPHNGLHPFAVDDTNQGTYEDLYIDDNTAELVYWSWPAVVDYINYNTKLDAASLDDIDYSDYRKSVLDILEDKIECNDVVTENSMDYKYYIGGDINFLSHDIYDGLLYSEIYVHVSNEAGLSRVLINNTGQVQEANVIEEANININNLPNHDKFSFEAVLLFYDIYKIGEESPYACNIPLGIFILMDERKTITPQELLVQSEELFGSGTAWSTRICSRFVSSATIGQDPKIGTTASDYSTLTRVLQEFGKAVEAIEKNITSREEDIQNIKMYLDNFKNAQTVNVPYMLDGWWYVNGKPVSHPEYLNTNTVIRDIGTRLQQATEKINTLREEIGYKNNVDMDKLPLYNRMRDVEQYINDNPISYAEPVVDGE